MQKELRRIIRSASLAVFFFFLGTGSYAEAIQQDSRDQPTLASSQEPSGRSEKAAEIQRKQSANSNRPVGLPRIFFVCLWTSNLKILFTGRSRAGRGCGDPIKPIQLKLNPD